MKIRLVVIDRLRQRTKTDQPTNKLPWSQYLLAVVINVRNEQIGGDSQTADNKGSIVIGVIEASPKVTLHVLTNFIIKIVLQNL